jgi:hypothetical protein
MTILGERRSVAPATRPLPNFLRPPDEIREAMGTGHAPGPVELPSEVTDRLLKAAVSGFRAVLSSFPTNGLL